MRYWTADTHFNHRNIIRYCNRPFSSVEEMDDVLISNINSKVTESDSLIIGGDFVFQNKEKTIRYYIERINCKNIILIWGNHDRKRNIRDYVGISEFHDVYDTTINGRSLFVCHYPIGDWPGRFRGGYHIHGHSHGNYTFPKGELAFDFGVDCTNFFPISDDEIEERMALIKSSSCQE